MKSSFCTIAFQKNKWGKDRVVETPLTQVLPVLASAGFDAAEIWWSHIEFLTETERHAIRQQLAELKLAVSMISPYFDFTTSQQSAETSMALAQRTISEARFFGSRGIRVFTGKTSSADATDEQWARCVRCLQDLADQTRDDNITWACETHSRNLMDTVEGSLRLMREVNRPNVRLIFQPSTFKEHYLTALDALAPYAAHIHASNSRDGQGTTLADGFMDYPLIFQRLNDMRFSGYVSIEWMGPDAASIATAEGAYLKNHLKP